MKKLKNLLFTLLAFTPITVMADSGLDSNYESSGSMVGGIINALLSVFSSFGKLIGKLPGDSDYNLARIIIVGICLITLYSITAVYVFKINKNNKVIIKLGISLIPALLLALLCFLVDLPIIVYLLIFLIGLIPLIIVANIMIKKRLKKNLNKLKELDKKFNEEDFYKDAFNVYKDVQIAWCNFDLKQLKKLLDNVMLDKYTKKLDELKKKKQKNIMENIEYKSCKITDVEMIDDTTNISVEMKVKCIDYIINDKDKVVKGKKDKPLEYKYKLVFSKSKKCDYVLIKKKLKSIK